MIFFRIVCTLLLFVVAVQVYSAVYFLLFLLVQYNNNINQNAFAALKKNYFMQFLTINT